MAYWGSSDPSWVEVVKTSDVPRSTLVLAEPNSILAVVAQYPVSSGISIRLSLVLIKYPKDISAIRALFPSFCLPPFSSSLICTILGVESNLWLAGKRLRYLQLGPSLFGLRSPAQVQYPTDLITRWIPLEFEFCLFRTRYFIKIKLSQYAFAPT